MIKKIILIVLVIMFAMLNYGCGESPEQKYTSAEKLVDEGRYKEALEKLQGLDDFYARGLRADLDMLINRPYDMQKETLLRMNYEEIRATKAGTNTKQYYTHPHINKIILENIAKIPNVEQVKKQIKAENTKKTFEQKRLSSWDGSNKKLEQYIKSRMNDPKSYEHIETRYNIETDKGIANMVTQFRGKNALGGVVVNSCYARQDIESGELLEIQWHQ